ncbi:MAG: hypothetical protein ACK4OP_00160 [Gemmobacter sp.]
MSDDEKHDIARHIERVLAPHLLRLLRWIVSGLCAAAVTLVVAGWQARGFVASIDARFELIHRDLMLLKYQISERGARPGGRDVP